MNCSAVANLIDLWIDQRLPEQWKEAVTGHLKLCADCRDIETHLRERLSQPRRAAPEGFKKSLKAAMSGPQERAEPFIPRKFSASLGSLAILAVTMAYLGVLAAMGHFIGAAPSQMESRSAGVRVIP